MELISIGIVVIILLAFFFVYRIIFGLVDHNFTKFMIGIAGCALLIIFMIKLALSLLKYF